jgi:hypothetical protein
MTAQIQAYSCATIIICLLTITGIIGWQLHSVEVEYKTYKDSINDQVQKAKIEKARIEAEQKAKYDRESSDYAADIDRLSHILDGLRKPKVVSGNEALRVAGSSASSLPREAEDTSVTVTALATREGACESSFYADSLETTLQCKALIEFVSK